MGLGCPRSAVGHVTDGGLALECATATPLIPFLNTTRCPLSSHLQHLEPGFAQYFAMARGVHGAHALDMQKFFDTNYHYMVPELEASPAVEADWSGLLAKVERGQAVLGSDVAVPILIGPITLVSLARYPEGTDASALVGALLPAYVEVLGRLKALGVPEVQVCDMGGFSGRGRGVDLVCRLCVAGACSAVHCTARGVDACMPCQCCKLRDGGWEGCACLAHFLLPCLSPALCLHRRNLDDWPIGKALPPGRITRFESSIISTLRPCSVHTTCFLLGACFSLGACLG